MRSVRTDLAMEAARPDSMPGVTVSAWETGDVTVTEVRVTDAEGARLLGKPPGVYLTLECPNAADVEARAALSALLAEELSRLLPPDRGAPVLVIGLGNREVTPDALGPRTIEGTLTTRHLFRELPDSVDDRMRSVCAIAPGVLGVTGVETLEIARGLIREVAPCAAILIDALAARATSRLGTAVQLTDTGVQPGSGVGNRRCALTRETLGVPVVAVGVPTVICASVIARDALDALSQAEADDDDREEALDALAEELEAGALGEMIVAPREIDALIERTARILAAGINGALHPGLSAREIAEMMNA